MQLVYLFFPSFLLALLPHAAFAESEEEWQDNIWPYRRQTAWDISTNFPYPRTLEYDVEEGTWLRLDIHPVSGELVFDMLGDIYCLPLSRPGPEPVAAHPILLGIPYDSDPHFSPDGDRLVFRSDVELGVENIWVIPWKGCAAMNVNRIELSEAMERRRSANSRLSWGIAEDVQTRMERLTGEGRLDARRVTNETFRWVSDARFHPLGSKVIASKWYTGTFTLAASEGWEYDVPKFDDDSVIPPGSGHRLLGRFLLPGMMVAEDYDNCQIGAEHLSWVTNDTLLFAKNVADEYSIAQDKDIHKGIYSIFLRNVTTGVNTLLVDAFPGGASRPELSRDKQTVAFVRRVRKQEVLMLVDIKSGTRRQVFDGLNYDVSGEWSPSGTYPSFAFTPSDDAVVIWGGGQIHHIPLTINDIGERVLGGEPAPIRFRAHIELQLAETLRSPGMDLVGIETQDELRINTFRDLDVDVLGEWAVFQAAGNTALQDLRNETTRTIPVLSDEAPYYSPGFVANSSTQIVHARWSDFNFTTFEIADVVSGIAYQVDGLPLGRYHSPAVSEGPGRFRRLAFVKTASSLLTGAVMAKTRPGLYLGDLVLPEEPGKNAVASNVHLVAPLVPAAVDRIRLRFVVGADLLLVQESEKVYTVDFGLDLDMGMYSQGLVVAGAWSSEIAVSSADAIMVAISEFKHIYVAPLNASTPVWAKPGNATKGLVRLSVNGAHDIAWSGDGKSIFWFSGHVLNSVEVARLENCGSEIEADRVYYGIDCVQNLVESQEVHVYHSTDIARLKQDAMSSGQTGTVVIHNASILTMEAGELDANLIEGGVMVVTDGVIAAVGHPADVDVPSDAKIIDANGAFLLPGFIDFHAHWNGPLDLYPAKSWEMQTFLAYGVTTIHNPSSDTVGTFMERSRLESGQFIGPRILTTGTSMFAGSYKGSHEEIVSMNEAKSALTRIKDEAGPVAVSYKNYQLSSRASRQRLLLTATELGLLCVPEGGGYYDWDLTYIIDGMTTVEHAIPPSILYEDAMQLFVQSGTGSTPTHVVSYGGPYGEAYIWANYDVPNDPKIRRFVPHDILEGLHESRARPKDSYSLFNTSVSTAKMVKMGLRIHIGAHGEHPVGHNYHEEMAFTKYGGLSNYEVLQAATSSPAKSLGIWDSVGTLTPGKLADFLLYQPGADLLDGDIGDTRKLLYIARGGRMWNAEDMTQVWPLEKEPQVMPPYNFS